jgi:hypothetical protein
MSMQAGKQWLETLKKRWVVYSFAKVVLLSLSLSLVISALLDHFFQLGYLGFMLCFVITFVGWSVKEQYWKISLKEVCRYLDLHFPELQESSSVLLKARQSLSFIEQLQLKRINEILAAKDQPAAPVRQVKLPLFVLIISIGLVLILVRIPDKNYNVSAVASDTIRQSATQLKETVLPQIASFTIDITPPGYTAKKSRTQQQFTLLVESGANVQWEIRTSVPVEQLVLLFNDKEQLRLKPRNAEHTVWWAGRNFVQPGFYQVMLNGKKSDFYQVEIIPDQPVAIKIIKPLQHSTIDLGQPQQVDLRAILNDDYGITEAYISATMASGKGEAVSFKEKKIPFNGSFQHKRSIQFNKIISLAELGMKPGDELYFYINATDNHGQQSRSDMYFVSIQDTTELMSMAGIDNGVNQAPEYFRSQRQLIIDTEKLLKDKSAIGETEFKTRSNDLGIDQKMLRMRYGKFLGEESEAEIGGGHEEEGHADHHEEGHQEGAGKFGDVAGIMDQYAHKHDNAEDATFFEPELKAQLKATLTEMWQAELRLRTYKPQEALPFEYKALRLLKDLQQKSRVYVAKTTFKTSTLKPEKRLTGELADIKTGVFKSTSAAQINTGKNLKQVVGILESSKAGQVRSPRDLSLLLQASQELTLQASLRPSLYLPALKSLKKIIAAGQQGKIAIDDIALAEKGLNSMLGNEIPLPGKASNSSSSALSKAYFNQLKRPM